MFNFNLSVKIYRSIGYNEQDKNWDILINFLRGKNILIDGKEMKVLDILGFVE